MAQEKEWDDPFDYSDTGRIILNAGDRKSIGNGPIPGLDVDSVGMFMAVLQERLKARQRYRHKRRNPGGLFGGDNPRLRK